MATTLRLIVLLFSISLSATAQSIIPLYPEGIPCANDLKDEEVMRKDIGRMITSVHTPLLEHLAPVPQIATGAAIMIIPGGGYTIEAWGHEGADIANHFLTEGLQVFILKHRLPRKELAPCKSHVALDDARRGVQTIRLLADSLGINRNQIAVMGFSAGGHLAASAAVHPLAADSTAFPAAAAFSSRPDLSMPIYPVLIMEDTKAAHQGSIVSLLGEKPWDPELLDYYNLPAQVHADVPPTFLVHAGTDKVVPVENSLRYYRALVGNDVPASLHVYHAGGHGFGSARQIDTPVREWLEVATEWLRGYGFVR
ncbi:alpha/beta hydrolase [Neolewinella persica]|uniref:alpha/beta hydrolase n=1 Tax=Neolewinella persica TaxID=70998 RepID=UPI0003A7F45B|nr:alpha/beta hydrolase [Neolewinella persica]